MTLPHNAVPSAPKLEQWHRYTRKDVHDIFAPHTSFTRQAGTWGLHGIVAIPDRIGDFVFFVTYGQHQGDHTFLEGVTPEGVLSWQSQPRQGLHTPTIRQLITHDALHNTIYLFLRVHPREETYVYPGRLQYLSHDTERQNPVYFQWQILDWDAATARAHIPLQRPHGAAPTSIIQVPNELREAPSPLFAHRRGVSTPLYQGRATPDYSALEARDAAPGLRGETLVLTYEQRSLIDAGRPDLAAKVVHVSVVEGDGAGYDILSYTVTGTKKYIEVKTTQGPNDTPLFITANELSFALAHPTDYYLYRVYGYDPETHSGSYFQTQNITALFELTPLAYRGVLLSSDDLAM